MNGRAAFPGGEAWRALLGFSENFLLWEDSLIFRVTWEYPSMKAPKEI